MYNVYVSSLLKLLIICSTLDLEAVRINNLTTFYFLHTLHRSTMYVDRVTTLPGKSWKVMEYL